MADVPKSDNIVVEKSTVSVKTAEAIEKKILKANLQSAVFSKLDANTFLAQRISSVNTMSALHEATGGNVNQVSYAVGTDTRIRPNVLNASVSFGDLQCKTYLICPRCFFLSFL
jgi:UDP-glucose 6-dehydrogenase